MSALVCFVVRHGESTWNSVRRWQGQSDPPLSDVGESQASAAGGRLAMLGPVDGIVTSSLRRARRTGELMSTVAGVPLGGAVEGLSERSAGPWEGLTRVEIEERYPGFLARGDRPHGYEPDTSVVERAIEAIRDLAQANAGRRLVVVSHGGVIHALERHAGGSEQQWQRLDNLEGVWVEFDGRDGLAVSERIHLLRADTMTTDPDDGDA